MFNVTATTKNNSKNLLRQIAKRKHELLDQFGRDHAKAADEILKESGQSSPPGRPPTVHSPPPNLETFRHLVDKQGDSVVSGPVFVPGSDVTPALPGAIELGGRVTVRRRLKSGRTVSRVRQIRARPFVVPSAERALVKFRAGLRRGLS